MAKYATAALALLVSLLTKKASAECQYPLIGGLYCPFDSDVSFTEKSIIDDSATLTGLVDPKTKTDLGDLDAGLLFFQESSIVGTYPTYFETFSPTMGRYFTFYGDDYHPWMVQDAALTTLPFVELEYSGPALTHNFDIQTGIPYVISEEIAKKAAQYTTTMIEMFQLMQAAVIAIGKGCTGIQNPGGKPACYKAVRLWDRAAAVQTGVNALAQKRCSNYATCGYYTSESDGTTITALSNIKTLSLFTGGQNAVFSGDIAAVKSFIKLIESATAVPFIQGTLRYTQQINGYTIAEKAKEFAEGSAFATGILPKVYECNRAVATLIDEKFQIKAGNDAGSDPTGFLAAVRSVYGCIGVTCEDIGGLIESGDQYFAGFGPCTSAYGNYITTH